MEVSGRPAFGLGRDPAECLPRYGVGCPCRRWPRVFYGHSLQRLRSGYCAPGEPFGGCRQLRCGCLLRNFVDLALVRKRTESASTRSSERPELDRCRESGAAISRLYVSGFPPITPGAAFAARPAIHPIVDRAALLAGAHSCVLDLA